MYIVTHETHKYFATNNKIKKELITLSGLPRHTYNIT